MNRLILMIAAALIAATLPAAAAWGDAVRATRGRPNPRAAQKGGFMKRLALLALAVTMMALGGEPAHADHAVAGCVAAVPNSPNVLGRLSGFGSCSYPFFVQDGGPYTIRLAAGGPLLLGPVTTGTFNARVSRWPQTFEIHATFVAGVLVDGTSSQTVDLVSGYWQLSVWYGEPPVLRQCLPLVEGCVWVYPGFGAATGSVAHASTATPRSP